FALRDLVLMVRKHQVEAATMNVKRLAEQLLTHGRALDVPAGTTRPPRTFPTWLLGLGSLPEGKVRWAAFAIDGPAAVPLNSINRTIGKLAVLAILSNIKVHVASRFVGKAFLYQVGNECNDFVHALRCTWEMINLVDSQCRQVALVVGNIFFRYFKHRHEIGRAHV